MLFAKEAKSRRYPWVLSEMLHAWILKANMVEISLKILVHFELKIICFVAIVVVADIIMSLINKVKRL